MSVVNPQSKQQFQSAYDDVQARLRAYANGSSIEDTSDARLLADYALSSAWAECNFDAETAAKRIRTEFYDRYRIDLSIVAAQLGHPPRFMTEVDDISQQLERDRHQRPHHRRRRLSTYVYQ